MVSLAQDRGPQFLTVFGTGTAIASILVLLRLWVRAYIIRKVGLDDWFVAASLVGMIMSYYFIGLSLEIRRSPYGVRQ